MKILSFFLLIIFGLLIWQSSLAAQSQPEAGPRPPLTSPKAMSGAASRAEVDLYFFYGQGCPLYDQTQTFLSQLSEKYSELKIKNFEVFYNQVNKNVYFNLGQAYNLDLEEIPVPVILIGEKSFIGYNSAIASNIEQTVIKCLGKGCISPIEKLQQTDDKKDETKTGKNLVFWFAPFLIIIVLIFLFKKRKV